MCHVYRGLCRSEMTMGDTSECHCVFILLISCWAVVASHVAEETNAGVTVFTAEITSCV